LGDYGRSDERNTLSIFSMIFSAHWTEAAINLSLRGLPWGPPNRSSAACMCRLARIAAMMPKDSSFVRHTAMSGEHSEVIINTETKGFGQGARQDGFSAREI
jgi:hypothetical protein